MSRHRIRPPILALIVCLAFALALPAQEEPKLSDEQIKDFLLNAQVISFAKTKKGVTSPFRLTLSDGKITHDAAFQSIDEYKDVKVFADGQREANFTDSYKYDIAAYELAVVLGLGDMMPVTVERKWKGRNGALSWWLPSKMDEGERLKANIVPPDIEAWERQAHRMRVFNQLVYDTDRNAGNALISENWHLWMIDFTRAFRLHEALEDAGSLIRCDRQLLDKLRLLNEAEFAKKTKRYLSREEISALMVRRNLIVSHFKKLIARNGEQQVLY